MIRQAAAYAVAAGIGSVVGTAAGTIFGMVLFAVIVDNDKKKSTKLAPVSNLPWVTKDDKLDGPQ